MEEVARAQQDDLVEREAQIARLTAESAVKGLTLTGAVAEAEKRFAVEEVCVRSAYRNKRDIGVEKGVGLKVTWVART